MLTLRTRTAALSVATASLLALAACAQTPDVPAARSQDVDIAFTACDQATCSGTINDAAYEIAMPDQWNGTLLLWSHGYRQPSPAPPDFEPVSTYAEAAPGWTADDHGAVADELLSEGFALAGSAYASNGWAVADGVTAAQDVYNLFVDEVGTPDRVVVWGDSLGGLVTAMVAEQNPDWVDGAAPMCGAVAGGVPNLGVALDVSYSIKNLIDPSLQLDDFDSWQDAVDNWEHAYDALVKAGSDVKNGVPSIIMTAALVNAPKSTFTYDGSTLPSRVKAYGEGALNALGYSTFGRYEIEQRFGGNPSSNETTDYATRISDPERQLIDTVGGAGTTDRLLAKLAAGTRVAADPAAEEGMAEASDPTGDVTVPTLALHTIADPLVLASNENYYRSLVQSAGNVSLLVNAYTVPPDTYTEETGAPFGAGHCNFTDSTYLGVANLMDGWVRNNIYPAPAAIDEAFGDAGYNPAAGPGPWPAGDPTGS